MPTSLQQTVFHPGTNAPPNPVDSFTTSIPRAHTFVFSKTCSFVLDMRTQITHIRPKLKKSKTCLDGFCFFTKLILWVYTAVKNYRQNCSLFHAIEETVTYMAAPLQTNLLYSHQAGKVLRK